MHLYTFTSLPNPFNTPFSMPPGEDHLSSFLTSRQASPCLTPSIPPFPCRQVKDKDGELARSLLDHAEARTTLAATVKRLEARLLQVAPVVSLSYPCRIPVASLSYPCRIPVLSLSYPCLIHYIPI